MIAISALGFSALTMVCACAPAESPSPSTNIEPVIAILVIAAPSQHGVDRGCSAHDAADSTTRRTVSRSAGLPPPGDPRGRPQIAPAFAALSPSLAVAGPGVPMKGG